MQYYCGSKMELPVTGSPVVAFVSNNCWSLYNFRMHLLRHYVQLGYKVIVIAAADEYTRELTAAGMIYYDVEFRNSAVDPVSDLRVLGRLKKIYAAEKPDIIFHYVTKPSIYGSFAAGSLKIPSISVITGLGYVYSGDNWLSIPVTMLFRRALRHAREVWFLNRENAGFFTGRRIIPPGKSKILPGEGIDTARFAPLPKTSRSETFIFLMVSRLLWSKGVGTYMEAARKLRQEGLNVEFRLLGKPETGHPESVSPEKLKSWEQEGLLVNLGFSNDVRTALAEADCFVLPTYYEEGIPRTLMEASSMQIPVITSDHTGCNSVIEDGLNGLLCKPRDAVDLARKMITMIHMDPASRTEMGRKGREKMLQQFDIAHVIRIYDDAIRRFVRR
ncbi:MAG TPA: glycosyltransferase family 4 protein [Chitinophagaceae bacterium]|nr:glycosyltransferase family 4 protein [Chitinophagaceae bacterium]